MIGGGGGEQIRGAGGVGHTAGGGHTTGSQMTGRGGGGQRVVGGQMTGGSGGGHRVCGQKSGGGGGGQTSHSRGIGQASHSFTNGHCAHAGQRAAENVLLLLSGQSRSGLLGLAAAGIHSDPYLRLKIEHAKAISTTIRVK
jgi:hypothetical protein